MKPKVSVAKLFINIYLRVRERGKEKKGDKII